MEERTQSQYRGWTLQQKHLCLQYWKEGARETHIQWKFRSLWSVFQVLYLMTIYTHRTIFIFPVIIRPTYGTCECTRTNGRTIEECAVHLFWVNRNWSYNTNTRLNFSAKNKLSHLYGAAQPKCVTGYADDVVQLSIDLTNSASSTNLVFA